MHYNLWVWQLWKWLGRSLPTTARVKIKGRKEKMKWSYNFNLISQTCLTKQNNKNCNNLINEISLDYIILCISLRIGSLINY